MKKIYILKKKLNKKNSKIKNNNEIKEINKIFKKK